MSTLTTELVIDGDTHIEEHPAVWEYLDDEFKPRKPVIVKIDTIPDRPLRDVHWFIDGAVFPRMMGHGVTCHGSPVLTKFASGKPASVEAQAILNVGDRLAAMDRVGVDVHVVYPTVFIQTLTKDLRYEAALMRSYNDYIAERAATSGGRLRWIATVPIRDVREAVREMRRCHSLGASGVLLLGSVGDQLLHEQVFDPFWEAAENLQMPICVHTGWSHDSLLASCDSPAAGLVLSVDLSLVFALFSFVAGGIFDRFPHLKVGLIEGGIEWFPVALKRMQHWLDTPTGHPWPARHEPRYYLSECAIYFGAGGDEDDLPHVLKVLGEDRLIGGQDFPHTHFKGNRLGQSFVDLRERDDVSDTVKRKMLCDNAAAFYGIKPADLHQTSHSNLDAREGMQPSFAGVPK
jgi:predicted TIM-barrel fold metal-dependent hydrolase